MELVFCFSQEDHKIPSIYCTIIAAHIERTFLEASNFSAHRLSQLAALLNSTIITLVKAALL